MLRLTLTIISAIIVGAAAFASVEHYTEATTASSITAHDADVNGDTNINSIDLGQVAQRFGQQAVGARPVAEQNLDANGNIRVAQQGPIDVNVLSSASSLRTIFDGDVAGGAEFSTDIVSMDGCDRQMLLFAQRSGGFYFNNIMGFDPSPDGTTVYLDNMNPVSNTTPGYAGWAGAFNVNAYLDVSGKNLGPHMRFRIQNGGAQHVTIQLYCR